MWPECLKICAPEFNEYVLKKVVDGIVAVEEYKLLSSGTGQFELLQYHEWPLSHNPRQQAASSYGKIQASIADHALC